MSSKTNGLYASDFYTPEFRRLQELDFSPAYGGRSVRIADDLGNDTYCSIHFLIGIIDIDDEVPSKPKMKLRLKQREVLQDAINKIEAYCGRYRPKKGYSKPRFRVKAVCVPMAAAA